MKIDSNVLSGGFLIKNIIVDPVFVINGIITKFSRVDQIGSFLSSSVEQLDGGEMTANKPFRFGPVAMSNTLTTNILNPPTATGGIGAGSSPNYIILRHIRILNKTAGAITFSMWLGATGANAAGTEVIGIAKSVAANDSYDWNGSMRLDSTDFLVGGASAAASLTIQGEGEIGVAG